MIIYQTDAPFKVFQTSVDQARSSSIYYFQGRQRMGTLGYPTRLTLDRNGPQGGTKLPEPPNEITMDLRIRSTLFARSENPTPRITVDPQRSQWTSPQTDHSGPIWGNGEGGKGATTGTKFTKKTKSIAIHQIHPPMLEVHLQEISP